ncbi:MAG: hypothetical protein IVW55_02505 [Chloroflexi bacterium]|nr:hypothetical protein [Chloroflexota bacterium]
MWNKGAAEFNVGSWLLWLISAMLGALLTRNPFYLLLVTVAGLLVKSGFNSSAGQRGAPGGTVSNEDPTRRGFGLFMRAVLLLLLVVTLFKGLSIHIGQTALFTLPEQIPVIGGPVTLEGLSFAAIDALSIMAVLAVFAAFSTWADYYALLRSTPAALHQAGLITSIAITFVPQTVVRFAEIREAQALRGHRVRRISDLIPLIVPLLSGGMERSMNLAEAMEARGFSRRSMDSHRIAPVAVQAGLALGLGLALTGGALFALLPSAPWAAWLCITAGILSIVLTMWVVGRESKRSRYRRGVWRERDTVLSLVSLGIMAILITYKLIAPATLLYDPLARLRIYMPPFNPLLGIALLAIAAPPFIRMGWPGQNRQKKSEAAKEVEGYTR